MHTPLQTRQKSCLKLTVRFKANLIFVISDKNCSRTKDETIEVRQPGPFVRSYKDKNGSFVASSGMRMSMAIRPQTVSNLASKFDSIINNDTTPVSKANNCQLKLRTYDISKIITELNKLNNNVDTINRPSDKKQTDTNHLQSREDASNNSQSKWCDKKDINKTQQFNKIGETTVSYKSSKNLCGKPTTAEVERKKLNGNHN